MLKHAVAILSALSIILGGIMIIWPQGPLLIGWIVITIGLIALIWSVSEYLKDRADLKVPRFVARWHPRLNAEDWLPFRRLIPMNVAVQRAFDSLQGRVAENAARRLSMSGEPLSYVFAALKASRLWGAHIPSTRLMPIPAAVVANGIFDMQSNTMRVPGGDDPGYKDVYMLRSDLRNAIRHLGTWDTIFPDWAQEN